jgi:mRNA-degrading endonuclease RelE of RelBE toxin-antitoxin system
MEIIFLRQAHRFVKKADSPLKEKIREEVLKIGENPKIGNPLTGKLKKLRSHHFSFTGTQYRVAYEVRGNLIIVAIGSRENFYRDLIE